MGMLIGFGIIFGIGALVVWINVYMRCNNPKKQRILGKIHFVFFAAGFALGAALAFGVDPDLLKYKSHSNGSSSITAQEEKQMKEAGYVKKNGKWYYQGDSPNNDKNKVTVTIEKK